MYHGDGNDEAGYKTWLWGYGNRGLSNTTVLKRVWVYLQPGKAHKYSRGYYNLICFASRNRMTQSELIRRLCRRADLDFWPSQVSRSGCVYRRASHDVEAVRARLEGVPKAGRYGYFHRVLDHKLVRCNKEEVKYLHDPVRSEFQRRVQKEEEGGYRSLDELLHRGEIKREATQLYNWLLENWEPRSLNVLCYLYENMMSRPTIRLADESQDNVYQLKSRLTRKLKDLIRERRVSEDVMRVLFEVFLQRLCQEIPASPTYRYRDEEDEPDL